MGFLQSFSEAKFARVEIWFSSVVPKIALFRVFGVVENRVTISRHSDGMIFNREILHDEAGMEFIEMPFYNDANSPSCKAEMRRVRPCEGMCNEDKG